MDKEQHLEADEQNVPSTPSPGQLLREAREAQGFSQLDIAEKMYLREDVITHIEDNYIDEATSITFVKGYVRLYAKTVGLNQDEVIAIFDNYHKAPKSPAKLQSFSRKVAKQAQDDRWMMVTYGIVFILIAGIVVWWFQQPDTVVNVEQPQSETLVQPPQPDSPIKASQSDSTSSVSLPQDNDAMAEINEQSLVSESDGPVQGTVQDDLSSLTSVSNSESSTLETEPTAYNSVANNDPTVIVETEEFEATTQEQPSVSNIESGIVDALPVSVVFTFIEDCWVNVKDATGENIAYGVKKSGYVMSIMAVPPVEVTLGAPSVVEINYAGEAVDMSGFNPTRTAKFNLPMQEL